MEINNSSLLILGLTYSVLILRLVMTNYAKKSIENRKTRKNLPDYSCSMPYSCRMKVNKTFQHYVFKTEHGWSEIVSKFEKSLIRHNYMDATESIERGELKKSVKIFKPGDCVASQCLAFLIPARNRESHLRQLMFY